MSDLQTQIERLTGLAKLVGDSEWRVRHHARELRELAKRVREKEEAMAVAGLYFYVSHIRRKTPHRRMDRRSLGRVRYPNAPCNLQVAGDCPSISDEMLTLIARL